MNRPRPVPLALALLFIAGAAAGQRQAPPRIPKGVTVHRDLVYASVNGRDLRLDLYLPASKAGRLLPVVVWIHGGGWRRGSKNNPRAALPLLEHGYALVSVEYRLSGEAVFPAAIEDCKAAVRWVRAHAAEYGIDPDRLGVWGSSAGGHLAALLGTAGDIREWDEAHPVYLEYSSKPNAVCDWYGPTDFLRMNDFPGRIDHDAPDSPESRFIGAPIQQAPEKTRKANPITYVTPDDPPMLLMHGDKDMAVPFNQSELLYAALREAGVEATLYKVEGGGHGFRGAVKDTRESLFRMVLAFFDRHLKPAR